MQNRQNNDKSLIRILWALMGDMVARIADPGSFLGVVVDHRWGMQPRIVVVPFKAPADAA